MVSRAKQQLFLWPQGRKVRELGKEFYHQKDKVHWHHCAPDLTGHWLASTLPLRGYLLPCWPRYKYLRLSRKTKWPYLYHWIRRPLWQPGNQNQDNHHLCC